MDKNIILPDTATPEHFSDATAAVDQLEKLYTHATQYLAAAFSKAMQDGAPEGRIRAFYPEIRITTTSFAQVDTRLAFGHVAKPGTYATTVTRPDLFRNYLIQQIGLLIENHNTSVQIAPSETPIPVQRIPRIFRTTFCLRTTSSMCPNSKATPAVNLMIQTAGTSRLCRPRTR
jgi:AMP nucleosidase